MIIRTERTEEFHQIYDLVKLAFQTAKVSNGKEQDFVDELRSSGNYIPELALVAEEEAELIGHIMLTRTCIVDDDKCFETLLLAPVSVVLEHRNKKVGSKLIKEVFRRAGKLGYKSVVVVGDPNYYTRFGFKTASTFGIKHSMDIPDEVVMARELVSDALSKIRGTVKLC